MKGSPVCPLLGINLAEAGPRVLAAKVHGSSPDAKPVGISVRAASTLIPPEVIKRSKDNIPEGAIVFCMSQVHGKGKKATLDHQPSTNFRFWIDITQLQQAKAKIAKILREALQIPDASTTAVTA